MQSTLLTIGLATVILGAGYVYHGKLSEDAIKEAITARDAYWIEKNRKANEQKIKEDKASERRYASIPDDIVNSEFERLHPSQKGTRCDCSGELRSSTNTEGGSDCFQRTENMVSSTSQEDSGLSEVNTYNGEIIYSDEPVGLCDGFQFDYERAACQELMK